MASTPELRRFEPRPAEAGRRRMKLGIALTVAFAAGLAALLLLAQLAGQRESQGTEARDFLATTLGVPQARASLVRNPAPDVELRVGRTVRFERHGASVGVALADAAGTWQRHLRGASRPAPFGREAVVFRGEYGLEHYLRVDERQGKRTWRWSLDAPGLTPTLAPDRGVDFARGASSAGIRILPAAIFDSARRNVTSDATAWTLERSGRGWTLALELDDAELPLPYVIDPNIARTAFNTAGSAGGVTSLTITRPGSVGNILVAQIAVRNNATVNAPAGWTPISAQNSGTGLRQSTFWATHSATLATNFTWTGSAHASGVIAAYGDVHPTSPIDASSANSGTGTTATATAVTTNFANSMLVPLYSAGGNVTMTQTGGQGVTQFATAISTGNPAGNRARVRASDGLQAAAGGSGNKTSSVSASSAWAADLVALRREPPDGLGTIAPDRTNVAASSAGNTLVWTYTAPADGVVAGEVQLTVPAGWSAPSATGTAAGYTTVSGGTLSFSGQTIVVSNLTLAGGATMTITYGSTAGGGPGATASATTGSVTWTAQQKGTVGGTLTNLAAQPSVTQNAPNGSGTISASRSNVAASSAGNTITFTYTAATGGMANGSVSLDVPAGWSAPSTTGTAAGFSTSTAGTLAVAGQTITVSGLTLAAGATVNVVYGSTASGGPGATASSSTGAVTWQTQQRSVNVGTLTNLATSPSITQNAPNGSGSASVNVSAVAASSTGNTLTFTYTAAAGGMADGSVSLDVPTGWSAPSTTGTAAGFSTSTAGTLAIAGQTITVSGLTLAAGATFDIVYGSTASGGPGATASSATGAVTWQLKQRSVNVGTLADLASSPSVTQNAPNGSGSVSVTPTTVGYATSGNALSFTYTAAAGGMTSGAISIDVPAGWSAPSTTATAAGYSTSTAGTLAVAGQTITVTGLTLAAGATVDIVYGSTAGGGPGATAPASAGAQTWTAKQRSVSSGTLVALGSSPSVTVAAQPAAPSGLATTPASPANDTSPDVTGTAPAGSTVKLYTSADCSGGVAASGTAVAFGGAGITVPVADNATTSLTATATDSYGAVSPCSTSISYTADSNPPSAPTISGSTPASPSSDNDPELTGSAEAGSTVKLFTTGDCSGAPAVSGPQATFAGAGLSVSVPADSSTAFKATATDAAGNESTCSAAFTYVEDSTAPSSSVSFPAAGATYGPATWNNPAGTASDPGGTVDRVEVSIRRISSGLYWDGSAFADASENWRTAAGAASWSLAFAATNFPADGDYAIRVRAIDTAANAETPSSRTITIDATAPNTTITAQPNNPTNSGDPSFSFTSSEGGSTFECRRDGGSWGACTSPHGYTGLTQGSHTFDVRATDASGNTDGTPASFTWTIDTTPPSSTLGFPAAADYNNAGWNNLSGTASDTGGAALDTVEVSVRRSSTGLYWDGSGFNDVSENWRTAAGAASWTLGFPATNFPADGQYVVRVRATDTATNVDGSPLSRTFTIDNAAPNTSIDSGPPNPTGSTDPSFAFSSTESGSTFECRLDGGSWSSCTTPKSYTGLAQGAHTFDVRATDAAGNTDASEATFGWTIDTTAPTSAVSFPSAGGTYSAAGWNDIAGTASDAGGAALDKVEVSIRRVSTSLFWDGSAFADGAENWRLAAGTASWAQAFAAANFPADDDYVVRVRASDTAANVEAPASYTVTYDTNAPNTTITAQPNDPTNSGDPSFSFTASEGGSTFECRLDGGAWSACTSPKAYTGLAQGSHTFDTRASDGAGNTDPTPASFTWTIDTTAPTSAIAFPADSGLYNASTWGDFSGTASDTGGAALDEVELSIRRVADGLYWNGSAFGDASENWRTATGTGSWSLAFAATNFAADGGYAIRVRAADTAGNVQAPVSRTFTVDSTAPETTIDTSPADPTSSADASFSFSASESGSTFECRLDGGSWSSCATPKSYTSLAEGAHTFDVRATDGAGNVDPSPATDTWTIDSTAPQTTIDTAPADPTNTTSADFTFSSSEAGSTFECRLDGGSWSSCTSPKNYSSLVQGAHTFDVRATDPAGNTDASPASDGWTIDTTDPTSAVVFPAAGGWYNATSWSNPSGTAADAGGAGLDRVEVSLRNTASGLYWDGSGFNAAAESWRTATGTAAWSLAFPASSFAVDGDYVLRARAVDAAGNAEAPSLRTFTVDTVPPETTIDSGPSNPSNSSSADFTFSSDQSGSTFECRLDGGSWGACASPKNYSGLEEGSHTFEVRAIDPGANPDATPAARTWVVDTVPPVVSMDDPGQYLRGTVGLGATATDTGGTGVASTVFQRSPAGAGTWTGIPATWDTTGTANGLYDLRVIATDNAGNSSTSAPITGRWVDNLKPTVAVVDPGIAVTGTVTIAANANDAHSGVEQVEIQYLDGSTWTTIGTDTSAPYEASWPTASLADGPYDLRAIATDYAGNVETSATDSTIVDNTDPTVSFTAPIDFGYVNSSAPDPFQLVADAADTGSGVKEVEFYECNTGGASCTTSTSLGLDGTAAYEGSWPIPATDGVKHLKAVARDNAGRSAEVVVEVTVDRLVPDTTLASNPGNPSRDPDPDFTFSSNEGGSTFECSVDGGAWAPCTTPHTTAPLADGTRTFEVRAIDLAGNIDPTPAAWTWLLDTTPPTAAIDDPGPNLRQTVTLTSVQADPGAEPSGIASVEFQYSVADANTWVATPETWDTTTVTDGLYDLRVVVTDNAGNVTESTPVEDRRIDNSPPATAIDDPGANMRATVTLRASASDTGSGVQEVTFQVSPDGALWSTIGIANTAPYELPFDTAMLPDGLYFFRTTATDVAGNYAEGAAVGPRRIDNTLPTATLNDPGANLRGTVNLSSTTDDPPGPPVASGVSSVVYEALIGGSWTGISETWPTTEVPDGVYDLRVVVTDVAGNQAISNVVAGRRVDNTKPTTGHNAPSGWQPSAVTVTLSASDAGSGVSNTTFSVDGGGAQSGNSVNVSGDGIHTISFFSTDVAGNIESPQTATVMIDTTPPDPGANDPGNYLRGTITLTANPTGGGGGGAEVTEVEFQHKVSSAGTWTSLGVDVTGPDNPPYSAVWATTPAEDGSWDLRFIVRDEAGNENMVDLASKIVDNTAPTGSLSSPLAGSTVSGNVTLGVSASDANPIASVEYFVNGGSVGSSGTAPFQVGWNSASGGDGPASISAVITDMAGNSTGTASVGVTVDNFAPTVTLSSPPANVSGSVGLSANASGDTTQVTFQRRPSGGGGWTTIGTAGGAPWAATFDTTLVPDGNYELRAIAVDAGANSGTSNIVSTSVDNTDPSGLLTRPGDGATVGGTVQLEATASDNAGGSGVGSVTWQAQTGGGGFADIAGDSSAPFAATWNVSGLPSGSYDLRIVVSDAAGNTFTSSSITVNVDSVPPGVTLNNPGSPLSGSVTLSASTTGDATSVTFGRSPEGAAAWTAIGTDGSAPWTANFNTTTVGDGVYDLRALVTDAVGNTNASVVAGIRIDNFVPIIVSSIPANGSIVASASQISITSTEDIAALTGVTFDGAPAPAPTISGTSATFNTGVLAEGTHTLSGTVRDAAGKSSAFSITFMVGVPVPPPDSGGDFSAVLPLVPAPTDFRGTIELDGSLTLRWTPSTDADGKPFATVLYVEGIATQTLAPGEGAVNLGPFDPADMRRFSIVAVDSEGNGSPLSNELRSTSTLGGRSLDEATAILLNRGFQLGAVRGTGTVVAEPERPLMASVGSAIDLVLGEPGVPQARLVFNAVGTKKYAPAAQRFVAVRVSTTRPAQVTATLLSPRGERVYRWRFSVRAGTSIKRLTMPPQVKAPGRYRLVLTAQSGRDSVKKTIALQIVGKKPGSRATPDTRPVEVVLAGGSNIRKDIALGLANGMRVISTVGEDTWTVTGSASRNVGVIVVDVDRYGLELVSDLRTVFPSVRIIALTNDPRRLAQAIKAGAAVAVPRSTPPKDLAKLITQLAKRR